jgi:hypothetical protein
MSKAPKEIWCSTGLYYEYKTDWSEGEWYARPDFSCVKYVRADRIEELEAKLANAMLALDEAIYLLDPDEEDIAKETGLHRIVAICAELKGEK